MVYARRGFTLIEVAIVLIVIGVLTGAILAGREMVVSARLSSEVKALTEYSQAASNFRQKYLALPGDFVNATSLWGTDVGCTGTAFNTLPKTATCNGSDDGLIGSEFITNFAGNDLLQLQNNGTTTPAYEEFRAWQHLSNGGFMKTPFAGVGNWDSASMGPANAPRSVADGGFVSLFSMRNPTSFAGVFAADYGVVLVVGRRSTVAGAWSNTAPLFTPEQMQFMDDKFDDGFQANGRITSFNGAGANPNPGCTPIASGKYPLTNKNVICSLIYKTGLR